MSSIQAQAIVDRTFRDISNHFPSLVRVLALPLAFYTAILVTDLYSFDIKIEIILYLLAAAVETVFAVNIHRIVLIGPHAVPSFGIGRWSYREILFFLYYIFLSLLGYAVLYYFGTILESSFSWSSLYPWVYLAGVIAALWFLARLSLVFPAIAVNDAVSPIQSWILTRNHKNLLFKMLVVFPILLSLPQYIPRHTIASQVVLSVFTLVLYVVIIGLLSNTYQEIKRVEYASKQPSVSESL